MSLIPSNSEANVVNYLSCYRGEGGIFVIHLHVQTLTLAPWSDRAQPSVTPSSWGSTYTQHPRPSSWIGPESCQHQTETCPCRTSHIVACPPGLGDGPGCRGCGPDGPVRTGCPTGISVSLMPQSMATGNLC